MWLHTYTISLPTPAQMTGSLNLLGPSLVSWQYLSYSTTTHKLIEWGTALVLPHNYCSCQYIKLIQLSFTSSKQHQTGALTVRYSYLVLVSSSTLTLQLNRVSPRVVLPHNYWCCKSGTLERSSSLTVPLMWVLLRVVLPHNNCSCHYIKVNELL